MHTHTPCYTSNNSTLLPNQSKHNDKSKIEKKKSCKENLIEVLGDFSWVKINLLKSSILTLANLAF